MTQFLWLIGVFVAALLGGLLGGVPIAFTPLVGGSLLLLLPMTILVAGIFAGLCAAWSGNWLAPEGVRRNLPRIVGMSEATAAILAVLLLALVFWLEGLGVLSANPFLVLELIPVTVALDAIAATLFTWRYRAPASKASGDALATLGFVGVMGFVVVWATGLLSVLSQFGI